MKSLLIASVFVAGAQAFGSINSQGEVIADILEMVCMNPQQTTSTLAFVVNWNTKTVTFKDIGAFGPANILKNEAFPIDREVLAQDPTQIAIRYDWHFTANYEMKFERPLRGLYDLPQGSQVGMTLNGDDDDGSFFNDVPFTCVVR